MLQCVEVSSPKTINITQYLNTNNFLLNNRHFIIKSSQTTQLYTTKVFYKQFSCHHHIKNHFWYMTGIIYNVKLILSRPLQNKFY